MWEPKTNNHKIGRNTAMSSPLTVPTMAPTLALTISKKDRKETIDYTKPIEKFLIFGSGTSITETVFTT